MIEHINVIDALHDQIEALLDLMQCAEKDVDIQSIKTAAEMSLTMLEELMAEVGKIENEWKADKEAANGND